MIFWHIKNMRRVYLPDANRSVFIRTNVPDGEIDYRYAVEVAHAAGIRRVHQRRGQHGHRGRRLSPLGDQHRIPAIDHPGSWSSAGQAEMPGLFGRRLAQTC